MSYILDALKKLERERNLGAVPNLDTLHLPVHSPDSQRSPWGWVLGISIALVAGLIVLLWRFMPDAAETIAESTPAPTVAEEPLPKARRSKPPQAAAKAESKPAPEQASPAKPPAAPAEPIDRPNPPPEARAEQTRVQAPEAPPAPAPATPPPKPKGDRTADAAVRSTAPTPERVERLRAAMIRRQQEMSTRPPPAEPLPSASPNLAAAEPPAPPYEPPAPKKPKAPKPPTSDPLKNYREVAASLGVPNLRLNMLAYSDDSAERIVNINSQTYHEGETVEGKIKIEGIVRDGAILSYGGQRFLLKP
jgi:hypothetical protein